jgi:hypothetical protein
MATPSRTTETAVTLRLSEKAIAKLAEQAASSGQDLSSLASDLVERAITRPSIAEVMAPVWEQVTNSGMSEAQIDDFLRGELDAHRREKKAKSA